MNPKKRKEKPKGGKPMWRPGDDVTAWDAAAAAQGLAPWQPAKVVEVLREGGEWLVEVRFEGGRASLLRPMGVRAR